MSEGTNASSTTVTQPVVAGAPGAVVVSPGTEQVTPIPGAAALSTAATLVDGWAKKTLGKDVKASAAPPVAHAPAVPATPPPATSAPTDLPGDALDALLGAATPAPTAPENELETIPLDKVDEKIRPNLAKMRTALESARKEASDLKKANEELAKKATLDPKEHEKTQTENKELRDTIGRISLENHPVFKAKYDAPRAAVIDNMKPLLQSYGVADDKLTEVAQALVRSPASARLAILKAVVPEDNLSMANAVLTPLYVESDKLSAARMAEMSAHQATLSKLTATEQANTEAVHSAMLANVRDMAINEIAKSEPLLQNVPGNEKRNAYVATIRAAAESFFATQDPLTHAKAFVVAATAPAYKALAIHYRTEYDKLALAFKERGIAMPQVDSRTSVAPTTTMPREMTSKEAMGHLAQHIRARQAG